MKVHNSFQGRQSTFLWSLTHSETISLVTYLEQDPDIVTLVLPQKRIKQSFLSILRKLPYHHNILRIVSRKQLLLLLMFAPQNICPTVFQKIFFNAEQFHNFVIILILIFYLFFHTIHPNHSFLSFLHLQIPPLSSMSSPTTTTTLISTPFCPQKVQASEGHQSNTPQQDTIRTGTKPQIKAGQSNPIETKGSQEKAKSQRHPHSHCQESP